MTLLEKLAPYLPYSLSLFRNKETYILKGVFISRKGDTMLECLNDSVPGPRLAELYKPILRPLSDLFKFVDYNDGNGEVMLGYKFGVVKIVEDGKYLYVDEVQAHEGSNPVANVNITDINLWLFKYHFDVFGMIESGEAIDINTLIH